MDKFIQLLTTLLAEAKDPATLLKRLLTILVALLIYFVINNTSEVLQFAKTFSAASVLEDQKVQRINNFPSVAKEKAMILFSQTRADTVFVVKYKPDSINDYQNIIAQEGNIQLDRSDLEDRAVDKTSDLYRRQLEGFNYVIKSDTNIKMKYSGIDMPPFKNASFKYIFTCPYFNLNNIYAGYIGIAWKDSPVNDNDETSLNEYLTKLCDPQRRALGRSI